MAKRGKPAPERKGASAATNKSNRRKQNRRKQKKAEEKIAKSKVKEKKIDNSKGKSKRGASKASKKLKDAGWLCCRVLRVSIAYSLLAWRCVGGMCTSCFCCRCSTHRRLLSSPLHNRSRGRQQIPNQKSKALSVDCGGEHARKSRPEAEFGEWQWRRRWRCWLSSTRMR
jgi:hypothetical protein